MDWKKTILFIVSLSILIIALNLLIYNIVFSNEIVKTKIEQLKLIVKNEKPQIVEGITVHILTIPGKDDYKYEIIYIPQQKVNEKDIDEGILFGIIDTKTNQGLIFGYVFPKNMWIAFHPLYGIVQISEEDGINLFNNLWKQISINFKLAIA